MGGPNFALRLPTYSPDGDIRASFLVLQGLLEIEFSEKESPKAMLTSPIDNILVEKAKSQMHLRNGENVVKTYRISLGKVLDFKAVP